MEGAADVAFQNQQSCHTYAALIYHQNLLTCNNLLDWLGEYTFRRRAPSQSGQSGPLLLARQAPVVIEHNQNTNYPARKLLQGFALWEQAIKELTKGWIITRTERAGHGCVHGGLLNIVHWVYKLQWRLDYLSDTIWNTSRENVKTTKLQMYLFLFSPVVIHNVFRIKYFLF